MAEAETATATATTHCSNKNKNTTSKLLNPWVLQFQKMGLELKCPLCLNLFRRPMLLPCDHIFCSSCLINSTVPEESECAVCKNQYLHQDLRPMPIVESIATIYRSLESNFSAKMFQNTASAIVSVLEPCQSQPKSKTSDKFDDTRKNVKRKYDAMSMDGDGGNIHTIKVGFEQHKECDIVDVDINQVMPSPCSDQGAENISLKGRGEVNGDLVEELTQLKPESSGSESEYHMGDTKRQRTNCDSLHFGSSKDSPTVLHASNSSNLVAHSSEMEFKSGLSCGASKPELSDESCLNLNKSICSFCQSSEVSEVTGPMLHYVNGTSVSGDAANKPNVTHVHRLCIEWAPRVYFHGESIKNLKSEITRGAKLKCGRCGLKGAALGCFVTSCRRTYHAPCATEISNCRWDLENFLMLCPAHSSVKFPKEKSKTKLQTKFDSLIPLHLLETPKDKAQKRIFCGSALSTEEKMLLVDFALSCGATVTKYWTSEVTHVIASTDENGACIRTLKVLMAILRGKWVLKVDWLRACQEAKCLVDEEPYEVRLDNHGCLDGPKAGRLRVMANESMLFGGLNFYFSGDFLPSYKEDLKELVVTGGGAILESKEELLSKCHDCTRDSSRFLVVYNIDPPQGCKLGEEVSILWHRLNEAQDLAASIGSPLVGHTWLLESIASCKLQMFC